MRCRQYAGSTTWTTNRASTTTIDDDGLWVHLDFVDKGRTFLWIRLPDVGPVKRLLTYTMDIPVEPNLRGTHRRDRNARRRQDCSHAPAGIAIDRAPRSQSYRLIVGEFSVEA